MANLRVINFSIIDSKSIKVDFNDLLNESSISSDNIAIEAISANLPNANVLKLEVDNNSLYVFTSPMTPHGVYKFILSNIYPSKLIKSINGNVLFEDGNTNVIIFSAPSDPDNDIIANFVDYFKNTNYDVSNENSNIRKILNGIGKELYRAKNTIKQVVSDDFLSILVEDEEHVRGNGPFERLENEGAYEILRVGPTTTDKKYSKKITIDKFHPTPISLQSQKTLSEVLTIDNQYGKSTFNGLICSLSNDNVIKVNSIRIIYSNATTFNYDISQYSYQIQDARYDLLASTYSTLKSNQIKLSDKAFDSLYSNHKPPTHGDTIVISYEYKDKSIFVNSDDDITVSKIKKSVREVCPSLINIFSLAHGNITDANGNNITMNGVSFYDPKANPPYSKTHPAFVTEIPYNTTSLPSLPGTYAIDYSLGKVYVFGEDWSRENSGTGAFPPVCTYYYKHKYQANIDYTFEQSLQEIATNTERNLIGFSGIVEFDYSKNYVENIDYIKQNHIEVLSEPIENRLSNGNEIHTIHQPITNVFRIFNETTGEIYTTNTIHDNKIIFNYNKPPAIVEIKNEKAQFVTVSNENLIPDTSQTNTSGIHVVKFLLQNSTIIGYTEDNIGSCINSSVTFSNTSLFAKEKYYQRSSNVSTNIDTLINEGEYIIDYVNSIIYLACSANEYLFGTVSYKHGKIQTQYSNIMGVINACSKPYNQDNDSDIIYSYTHFDNNTVTLKEFEFSDSYIYNTDNYQPITINGGYIQLPYHVQSVRGIYELSALTSGYKINFANISENAETYVKVNPITIKALSTINGFNQVIILDIANNPNFELISVNSIIRLSDNAELYKTTLSNGSFATNGAITLPSDTVGISNDNVLANVTIQLSNGSIVVVDMDLGGIYIDYRVLYDKIIVSYEYGDNCLDFRGLQNSNIKENTTFYVTYKYGALRDALLSNFGSSINISDFQNFNVDFERERYRDALMACLQNFPKGPTKQAISNIAKTMSHVEPIIIESIFQEWILGLSKLAPSEIETIGTLLPAIWDNGIYFDNNDHILLPVSSNVKLNNGTMEFWVIPNWNGIDNNASITFTNLTRDGVLIPTSNIWIGNNCYNPTYDNNNSFTLNKNDTDKSPIGIPTNISDDNNYGVFIYYDIDVNRWKLYIKDLPA